MQYNLFGLSRFMSQFSPRVANGEPVTPSRLPLAKRFKDVSAEGLPIVNQASTNHKGLIDPNAIANQLPIRKI